MAGPAERVFLTMDSWSWTSIKERLNPAWMPSPGLLCVALVVAALTAVGLGLSRAPADQQVAGVDQELDAAPASIRSTTTTNAASIDESVADSDRDRANRHGNNPVTVGQGSVLDATSPEVDDEATTGDNDLETGVDLAAGSTLEDSDASSEGSNAAESDSTSLELTQSENGSAKSTEEEAPLGSGESDQQSASNSTDEPQMDDNNSVSQPGSFSTDFSAFDPGWNIYYSEGHAGIGLRRPSAITIEPDPSAAGGSVLKITADMGSGENEGQIVTGGIAFPEASRTYGRYTFRVRVEKDPSKVTSGVSVLWPVSNLWPLHGEINMFETWNHRDTRRPIEFNVHWLNPLALEPYELNDSRSRQVVSQVDGSEWHTYTYEWSPDLLSVSVDGGPAVTVMDDPDKIPRFAMTPTFQVDAFSPTGTRGVEPVLAGPVSMYVDFLSVEPLE